MPSTGHTATLYDKNKLIVFGGENEHREYLSDIVIFDIDSNTWTSPELHGPIPRGRARHAAVVYEDKLFIVGGITGETNYILDDICYLDLKTRTWSQSWSFAARFDHTAWVWGGRLWIFGGLGADMERGNDLWWLDLKGSSSFGMPSSQGTVDSPPSNGRITHNPGVQSSSTTPLPGRSSGYVANSASVQIRTFNRRRPVAPGAISSLKFHSGPHIPALLFGRHFHIYTSGVLLDLVTPTETVRPRDCNMSSLELDSFRWQRIANGSEILKSGYRWHYCTVNEDGTKAWLLGCNLDTTDVPGIGEENNLTEVLQIDLQKFGILGNELMSDRTERNRILASERQRSSIHSGLGADLLAAFDQPPECGSGTDFIITAEHDDKEYNDANDSVVSLSPQGQPSNPIHVHKIILQTRWPHFKRLYASQMVEYHTKKMHIPEPYSVVRAFLYYLYTDSIASHPQYCSDISDVAGMLVMANLYDIPRLRVLCVNRLSRELDVSNAAVIWERAVRTNEGWLKRHAAAFCLANWGRIVRTDAFRSLSRQSLVELCEMVDTEGRVVPGHELDADGSWGFDGLGTGGYNSKRPRLGNPGTNDDVDEVEGEYEENMEIL